jgi:hypothetical protein
VRKARPRAVYDAATGVNVQTSGTTVPGGALTGGGCIRYRVQLSAIRALVAGNGLYDLDLFTGTGVLDKMPDVDDKG